MKDFFENTTDQDLDSLYIPDDGDCRFDEDEYSAWCDWVYEHEKDRRMFDERD